MVKNTATILVLIQACIKNGCYPKPDCTPDVPVFVWPLHSETGLFEIMTNTSNGVVGTCNFNSVVGERIDSAAEFSGETGSYVNLAVDENAAFMGDYTIQFYLNAYSVTSGILIQYKSLMQTEKVGIKEWNLFLDNGDINVVINNQNDEQIKFYANIEVNSWCHVIIERDFSKDTIKLYVNRKEVDEKKINNVFVEKPTFAPGKLYLGEDSRQNNNLHGMVSCVQIIPCKETTNLKYDSFCKVELGMLVNPHTTVVTTVAPTTITTTVAPTTTTTSVLPITTTTIAPKSTDHPKQAHVSIEDRCSHFTLLKADATFNDIIISTEVADIVTCSKLCNQYKDCFTFAVRQRTNERIYQCKLGLQKPIVLTEPGSKIYRRNY